MDAAVIEPESKSHPLDNDVGGRDRLLSGHRETHEPRAHSRQPLDAIHAEVLALRDGILELVAETVRWSHT